MKNAKPRSWLSYLLALLTLPSEIHRLADSVDELNDHLAALRLQGEDCVDVLGDMRKMVAPLLGWKVIEKGRNIGED